MQGDCRLEIRQGIRGQREVQGGQVHPGGGATLHRHLEGEHFTRYRRRHICMGICCDSWIGYGDTAWILRKVFTRLGLTELPTRRSGGFTWYARPYSAVAIFFFSSTSWHVDAEAAEGCGELRASSFLEL